MTASVQTNPALVHPEAPDRGKMLLVIALISLAVILFSAGFQIGKGAYVMDFHTLWNALTGPEVRTNPGFLLRLFLGDGFCDVFSIPPTGELSAETLIVWNIRIPRLLCALAVGINLAFSGCIFQAVTRNEMASPYLLGISQGAGLMILLTLVVFPSLTAYIPLFAMAGGVGAFFLVYSIAWNHGASPVRLILAGIIVGAVAGAVQTALTFFIRDMTVAQNAVAWTSGSLIGTGWTQVRMIFPWSILTAVLCLFFNRNLDILLLGDRTASSLGMNVERWRFGFALIAIMSAASAVSVAGLIGFVGLIVPHIGRALVGSKHGHLFPACLFAGPALLIFADTASRLILSPIQLPVGMLTGAAGGIFFLFLMRKKREFGRL